MSALFDDPALFRSLLEELPIGIYVVDRQRRIRFWNRGAEHITGHLAYEVVGQCDTGHLLQPCDRQGRMLCDEHSPVAATLDHGQAQQFSAFYLHKNGHRVAVRIRIRPIFEHGDVIVGAINLFEEAFAFRDDGFGHLMYGCLDATTGVPAHRLTRAVLNECVAGVEQSHSAFGLLRVRVLGLNEFRSKHGPQSIVPFLRTTAQTLRHNLDSEDFLGRWGEDEFLAVLQSTSPMMVTAAAECIRRLLGQSEITWWGDRFQIEAEVQSVVVRPGDKLESLLGPLKSSNAAENAKAAGAGGMSVPGLSRG
jgi:PAS domain S-box-containing protein